MKRQLLAGRFGPDDQADIPTGQDEQRTLGPLILTEMDIAANAVATYYPECNDLIDLDTHAPDSRTPSYKSVTVVLQRVTENTLAASA